MVIVVAVNPDKIPAALWEQYAIRIHHTAPVRVLCRCRTGGRVTGHTISVHHRPDEILARRRIDVVGATTDSQ